MYKRLMEKIENRNIKNEFLPSALEIIETPPSPTGRITIWIIFALIMIAIVWSVVGKVDEVAIGRGKVIPYGKVKVIQTPEDGVILDLLVEEGDIVHKGQKLVELDSTLSEIEYKTSKKRYENLNIEIDILEKELSGETVDIDELMKKGVDRGFLLTLMELREQNRISLENNEKTISHEIAEAHSNHGAIEVEKKIIEKKIDMLREEVDIMTPLYEANSISKVEYQKKCDELTLEKEELSGIEQQLINTSEKIEKAKQSLLNLSEEYKKELLSNIVQKQQEIIEAEASLDKSRKVMDMNYIHSPVDGKINGLGDNAIGSVVQATTPIMTIVPKNTPMIIEASILNKDIGFVNEGQMADIKVDTFPFQKYGVIEGEIVFISPDAYQDESLGEVYKIKVRPLKTTFDINGKIMEISPGMTTTVEVKVGRRRIIEFFLPAADYIKESFELR